MNIHQDYDDDQYQEFPPHRDDYYEDSPGPYRQQYSSRGGASQIRNFAPRARGILRGGPSRLVRPQVPRFQSNKAAENTPPATSAFQFGKGSVGVKKQQDSENSNQKQGPAAENDQIQNSRDNDQSESQDKSKDEKEQAGDGSWEPLKETVTDTKDEKDSEMKNDDMDVDKDDDDDDEDEKTQAIKKLPAQHGRGLMSTLIALIGPEAQNKKPDPLPPPKPMRLEDDNEKYLGPKKSIAPSTISESAFLESGITAKMLAEANAEIDFNRDLLPEDIGCDIGRPEFYCKPCQKQMTSLGNFRDHLNGKSHKSTMEAVRLGKKVPKKKKGATTSVSELGKKSVCLDLVEGATEPIIGLSFITEYHSVTGVVCVCNLCAVKFDQNIVVSHTTGCKHRLRYMKEKDPNRYVHLKKFGGKKSQLTTFLADLCVEVEQKHGRGRPNIKVYNPEGTFDQDDTLDRDDYAKRQLINAASRRANVDDKELENVDFQDWVDREMRRAKELYDANNRSPSPGYGDYGRSNESFRSGSHRSPSEMRGRNYSENEFAPFLSKRPVAPPPPPPPTRHSQGRQQEMYMPPPQPPPPTRFSQSHQNEMYMPPPMPPPPFSVALPEPPRFNAFISQGSFMPVFPVSQQYANPVSYNAAPLFYGNPGQDPSKRVEPTPTLISSNEVPGNKSALLFDYGHGSSDKKTDDFRTSTQPTRSRTNERNDTSTSRQPTRSRAAERDDLGASREFPKNRNFDVRELITSKQVARSRAEDRGATSRQPERSRPDERDRQPAKKRADDRDISNFRPPAKKRADERDISNSRPPARNRTDERVVHTSVSRADKWEDDIQHILGYGGTKSSLNNLAILSHTYSSPDRRSPTPPRKVKKDLLDRRRNSGRAERFIEVRSHSRSPEVMKVHRRSPETLIIESSPEPGHLTRRYASQRVDSRGRSRSPRRSRSPSSPVRSYKKPAATSSNIDTDAEAERIANLLLELSSSLSGQEDPKTALQTLFSNADLTRALLSSKINTTGANASQGEEMHSARSTEVGEPSGRHYSSVEQPSRYMESPDKSRRYTSTYSRSPERMVMHPSARAESSRAHGSSYKPAARSTRDRVAFSVAGFNRAHAPRNMAATGFANDSDDS
ncbi:hypothetical protein BsWGS_01898 [Bradybaena similaris]